MDPKTETKETTVKISIDKAELGSLNEGDRSHYQVCGWMQSNEEWHGERREPERNH